MAAEGYKPEGQGEQRPEGHRLDIDNGLRLYGQAKEIRSTMEPDWRMCAGYCLPRQYNAWLTEGEAQVNNAAARRLAYDNTGMKSLPKYAAILNAIHTPLGSTWHRIEAHNSELMRRHEVKEFCDNLNAKLFKLRYQARANFIQSTSETYGALGLYGTGPRSLVWGSTLSGHTGFKYKAWPLRDVFILVSDDGEVTHVFRRFFLNARQWRLKWPDDKAPKSIASELEKTGGPDEKATFEIVQILRYRDDYDPYNLLSNKRHRIICDYVAVKDKEFCGDEEAYSSMPMLTPSLGRESGNPYGYSAAQLALPAMGGVSAIKKTAIKQGHKAVDPAYISNDDGNLSSRLDVRPGRVNPGGVNAQGQKMIHALETGNFQVAEKMIEDERADIEDPFWVKLFTILYERPQMSVPQVVDEIGQRATLVGPTMGILQSELGEPTVMREIEILTAHGLRPEMPPALIEAGGMIDIRWTSPMAKALYAEDIAGFMRWVEFNLNYAQTAQDPTVMDRINMDKANPDIAAYMNVQTAWVCSDDEVKVKAARRDKAMARQQVMDQAPAIASVVNTAAKTNGSNTPGVTN